MRSPNIPSIGRKEDEMKKHMKRGTKVRTIYGAVETVLAVNGCQVITYESAQRLSWYHATKVTEVRA